MGNGMRNLVPYEPWHRKLHSHRVGDIYPLRPRQYAQIFYAVCPVSLQVHSFHIKYDGVLVLIHRVHLVEHAIQ